MDNEKIGKYILKLRTDANLSQNQLAEMIPISRQAISKWERGENAPDSQTLIRLSEIFNVTIDSLILGRPIDKNEINQQSEKLKLDMVDEHNKKVRKIKRLYISIAIIFLTFIISFLSYYFINTYNTTRIYSVVGENGSTFSDNGLLILSRNNLYFKLGDITTKNEIKKLELYYKNELIYSTKDKNIFLRDYLGFNSYFKFDPFDDEIKNIFLRIYFNDNDYEVLELQFIKDFTNDNLIFENETIIAKDENKDLIIIEDEKLIQNIQEKFEYIDNIYTMNEDNINFTYFADNGLLIIRDGDSKKWNYYLNEKTLEFFDNEKEKTYSIVLEESLNDNEIKIYLDFYSNYIKKYIL